MNNSLRHKSILFLLTTMLSVTGFGTFARMANAALTAAQQTQYNNLTASQKADVDTAVSTNALVMNMTTALDTAQKNEATAKQKVADTQGPYTTAQGVLATAQYAFDHCLESPYRYEISGITCTQRGNTLSTAQSDFNTKKGLYDTAVTEYSGTDGTGGALGALNAAEQALADAKDGAIVTAMETQKVLTEGVAAQQGAGAGVEAQIQNATPTTQVAPTGNIASDQGQTDANIATNKTLTPEQIASKDAVSAAAQTTDTEDKLLAQQKAACSLFSILGGGSAGDSVMACLATAIYYYAYKPASIAMSVAGYIFDSAIVLSIDKNFVNQDFISAVWTVIRDFSNMLFIFVLLFAGIQTMFGLGNYKETIRLVIIIALLLNFSLFFTKVVIDAGNILAVGVFQAMGVARTDGLPLSGTSIPQRTLSQSLVAGFRPQQFFDTASKASTNNAALVFILAGIVNGFVAYVLFRAALLFVGRLLIFWFLMIISPFAFISYALPIGNIFTWWWGTLTKQTFMAPTFLFLLYLVMKIIETGVLTGFAMATPTGGTFFFASVIGPILVAVMIILALHQILKITEDMAGELGRMAQKYAGQALGVGAAVASGGASLVAGGGSSLLLKGSAGKYLREKAKGDGFGGRLATRATLMADKAQKGSWDVRNIGGKDSMFGATVGGYIGQGVGSLGIGKGGNKGGYQKAAKEKAEAATKKDAERAKVFEMSKGEEEKMTEALTSVQKGAHEDAEKIVKTLEDSVKEKEAKVKDAEKVVNNSPEGIRVTTAKETFDKKDKEAKELAKANEEKIKELEEEKSKSVLSEAKERLDKKIEELKESTADAKKLRDNAEQELKSATEAPEMVAKNKNLSEAKEVLGAEKDKMKEAKEDATEKKKLYEDAKKEAKVTVEEKQADRREAYAQKTGTSKITRFATGAAIVGAGATMGPAGVVAGGYVARTIDRGFQKANEERVKKIRKGKTSEEKEEESLSKALKKAMADQKKKEEKEVEGETEEKEHKK